jgi:hypothetical protein
VQFPPDRVLRAHKQAPINIRLVRLARRHQAFARVVDALRTRGALGALQHSSRPGLVGEGDQRALLVWDALEVLALAGRPRAEPAVADRMGEVVRQAPPVLVGLVASPVPLGVMAHLERAVVQAAPLLGRVLLERLAAVVVVVAQVLPLQMPVLVVQVERNPCGRVLSVLGVAVAVEARLLVRH